MVDMHSYCVSSRETSRAGNPNCLAADFHPASILAGGEGIVRFSISAAGNKNELKLYYRVNCLFFDSEVNTVYVW